MVSVMSRAILQRRASPLLLALNHGNIYHAKYLMRVHPELASQRINQQEDGIGYSTSTTTVMHYICDNEDAATVKALVEVQPDYFCYLRDDERRTPQNILTNALTTSSLPFSDYFCYLRDNAAEKGKEDVVRALVSVCPNSIHELNSLAETPLHVAIKNDYCPCFLVLMEQLQKFHYRHWIYLLNRRDFEGNTLLHIAVLRKQIQVLGVLLSYKHRNGDRVVDVNSINKWGYTALDLHSQKKCDRNDKDISDILHEAGAKKGHELPATASLEGQPSNCSQSVVLSGKNTEKTMMQENMGLMKKSLLLAVFIFIANASYDSLFNLSDIYSDSDDDDDDAILIISFKEIMRSPKLVPDVFYVIMANSITFLGSMAVILGYTWSMATKCSLCYRALPLLVSGAMVVSYGLVAKKIMPNFWVTIGDSHKIPSFWMAICFFDLPLLFSIIAAWLIGKHVLK